MFCVSLAVLVKASDLFVEAAETIGLSFGVSPLIIGVTIVAFGTSLPELASSLVSVVSGKTEIVIGNVVGSNIANILLVLGVASMFVGKLSLNRQILKIEYPLVVVSAFLLLGFIWDGKFVWWEGLVFLIVLVSFLLFTMNQERDDVIDLVKASWKTYTTLVFASIFVYFGSEYTVDSIVYLSEIAEIPPDIISLSLLALGTSLPEVAVSIQAARKGKTDIALGNVLGSNVFNTLAVMGIPSIVGDLLITDNVLAVDIWVMLAASVLLLGFILKGWLRRWHGIIMVTCYLLYFLSMYL